MKYFLSLGSNLGNRKKNLSHAVMLLEEEGIKISNASSIFRSQPVDYIQQPWFYNQVIEVNTPQDPLSLLKVVKRIEQKMKRVPTVEKGPRIIDIDILLAGRTVIQTRNLMVPHPRMNRRNFVLIPLREIAPDAVHPLLHMKIADLMELSPDPSSVRRLSGRSRHKPAAGLKKALKTVRGRGKEAVKEGEENRLPMGAAAGDQNASLK